MDDSVVSYPDHDIALTIEECLYSCHTEAAR